MLDHRGRHAAHAEEHARDVDVDHAAEVLHQRVRQRRREEHAGVVEQHVDAPVRVERVRDDLLPASLARDVVAECVSAPVAQLVSDALRALLVGVRQQQQRALLCHAPRGRRADAAGRRR